MEGGFVVGGGWFFIEYEFVCWSGVGLCLFEDLFIFLFLEDVGF